MFYLTRRQFPDLLLDADDLDAAADVWFAWYDDARQTALTDGTGYHRLEGRLWGFPRHDADRLARALEAAAAAGPSGFRVERRDPDTLAVATPYRDLSQPCSLAEVLRCFAGPEFEGLPLMVRVSLHDWRGPPEGPPARGCTLVLCGQLERGKLLLKGVWPVGLIEEHEAVYRSAAWSGEETFLQAISRQRALGGAEPGPGYYFPPAPENYFTSRSTQAGGYWLASRFLHIPGDARLPAFLERVAFFAVLALAALVLNFWLLSWRGLPRVVLLVLFAVPGYGLLYVTFVQALKVVRFYRSMHAALKRIYSRGVRFLPVDLAAVGAWPDPHAAKYSAEIEAEGARHYLDATHDPPPTGTAYFRMFVLPEDHTYVHLILHYTTKSFVQFPAHAHLLVTTYFADGERLTTANSEAGFRKKLNPKVIVRYFEDAEDPATMLAKHRRVLRRLLAEGRQLLPLLGPEDLLRRLEADHEEMRRLCQRHGYYSWSAAFRQAFRLVRPEYRHED
jgi:hypothetical protein